MFDLCFVFFLKYFWNSEWSVECYVFVEKEQNLNYLATSQKHCKTKKKKITENLNWTLLVFDKIYNIFNLL